MYAPCAINDDGQFLPMNPSVARLFMYTDWVLMNDLDTRTTSLETWRAAKATASPDVSTSVSVPTAVITLGLNAPTAAGLNAILSTVMGEVNGLKAILRTREILAP